jgi:tetratricopeptide (TPR) repeat protein
MQALSRQYGCVLVSIFVLGLPSFAPSLEAQVSDELQAKLTYQIEYLKTQRYRLASPVIHDRMGIQVRKSFPVHLMTDVADAIVATCGVTCDRVQITLYNQEMKTLMKSPERGETAIIIGNPLQSGLYEVEVTPACRAKECAIALVVLQQEPQPQVNYSGLENIAHAYHARGIAYYDKGEYDLAIADFNTAIGIKPIAGYYNNRGNAY